MQNLRLNILTFTHPVKEKVFHFSSKRFRGSFRFNISKLPESAKSLFPDVNDKKPYLYTNFNGKSGNTKAIKVNLLEHHAVARIYYKWAIHNYLSPLVKVSRPNFLTDNEYWFYKEAIDNFWVFKKFTIRVQFDEVTDQPELLISFNGTSKVVKDNIETLTSKSIDTEVYNNVIYNKKLLDYETNHKRFSNRWDKVYPVLNPELFDALGLTPTAPDFSPKYLKYFNNITEFFNDYINTKEFKKIIPHNGQWKKLDKSQTFITSEGSYELEFGKKQKNIDAYYGIKDNGPFEPSPHKHIKIFLILHKSETETAQLMGNYFLGKRGFIAFKHFLKLPFTYEKDKHILFSDLEDPMPEIRQQLADKDFSPGSNYLAIYISPFDRHESNRKKRNVYFKVKEELLNRNITSQFIHRESVHNTDFKYFISNMGVAILAKLDGIPWRLDRPPEDELIVGVGAFKSRQFNARYLGSAFCFSNDGRFKRFDFLPESEMFLLAGSIGEAVENFRKQNKEAKRLIIHFYKNMSQRELRPIEKELKKIGQEMPIVILSVNKSESKDIVFFDEDFNEKIPMSGSYIPIGNDKYLLCCNSRFPDNPMKKTDGRPLPVKIHIKSTDESIINDPNEVRKLIDQVYQFSRLNWSSIRPSSMPVTLKYPEMISKIVPHFEGDDIPEFGKTNLWFL